MPKYSTAFGMDVHLRSTTVCALDADTGEAVTRRFPGNPWGEIAGWMDGFPGPSLAAYESGYLGFAPQRELAGLGVECVVAAVSKILLTSMYFCPIAPIIFAPSRQLTMSSRTNANCPILAILLSSSFPSARP
ncbi:hypothetical protein ACTQ40_03830 [Collinsella sp. Sow4_D11]|uniref:hypothetical protein n=1 Tax=Collinsella sp. Sow4_D11 TaxID=3438775 RepID=UPI003F9283DF